MSLKIMTRVQVNFFCNVCFGLSVEAKKLFLLFYIAPFLKKKQQQKNITNVSFIAQDNKCILDQFAAFVWVIKTDLQKSL